MIPPTPCPPDLTCLPGRPPSPLPRPGPTSTRHLRVTGISHRQPDKADTDPHTTHRVPDRVSCTTGGVVRFPVAHTGARLTPRLTPSVDRRTRLAASTSTRTRTRARAARHTSSLQRIVSGSTGCVLPARCSLHMLHSLE